MSEGTFYYVAAQLNDSSVLTSAMSSSEQHTNENYHSQNGSMPHPVKPTIQ